MLLIHCFLADSPEAGSEFWLKTVCNCKKINNLRLDGFGK
jgi:hypothetical protein